MPPLTPGSRMTANQILCPSITSKELEGNLDQFLQKYHDNGHDREYGVLLIQSLPISKARKSGNPSSSTRPPLFLTKSSAKTLVPGCYVLETQQEKDSIDWVSQVESQARPGDMDLPEFLQEVDSGRALGIQCQSLKSTTQGLRQALNIRTFPVSSPDKKFRSVCSRSGAAHLCSSYISIATSASPQSLRTSLARLTTICFHHRGSPRHWIVVPPTGKAALEKRMCKAHQPPIQDPSCSQFVSHLDMWISPGQLGRWGISYFSVTQRPDQLLVLFPDAYYFGYSSGFSIVESKFHAGPHWDYQHVAFCNLDNLLCLKAHDGTLIHFPTAQADHAPSADGAGSSSPSRSPKRPRTTPPVVQPGSYISPYDPPNIPTTSLSRPAMGLLHDGRLSSSLQTPALAPATLPPSEPSTFDISDDDDGVNLARPRSVDDSRISRLQQENSALLRDIQTLKAERDQAVSRKAMYKARLLERESYIRESEDRVREAAQNSLHSVAQLVENEILKFEAGSKPL